MLVLACSLYASHADDYWLLDDEERFCLHWGHCPSSLPCCAYRGPGSHNICKEDKGLYSVDGEDCVLPTVGFNTDRKNWIHTEDPFEPCYDPYWSNVFNCPEQLG